MDVANELLLEDVVGYLCFVLVRKARHAGRSKRRLQPQKHIRVEVVQHPFLSGSFMFYRSSSHETLCAILMLMYSAVL